MRVCCPTAMHTGTRTLLNLVLPEFALEIEWQFYNKPGDYKLSNHTAPVFSNHIRTACESMDMVCTTLRHPAAVWESFKRRERSYEYMTSQWGILVNVVAKYSPYYLHVDRHDIRDSQAQRIRKAAGLPESVIDWTPTEKTGAIYGTHDLVVTDEMEAAMPGWMVEFYKETALGNA